MGDQRGAFEAEANCCAIDAADTTAGIAESLFDLLAGECRLRGIRSRRRPPVIHTLLIFDIGINLYTTKS